MTLLRVSVLFPLLFLASLSPTALYAARDNDYYYPGFVNPNTEYHMYWKDSINVLEDLDQFESLYVTYHGCVWSKYGTMYGTGEDYDEQDGDNDDDGFENGCGGFGGGEYYWYMGRTQCFKANIAYSLYGVLKTDEPQKKKGSFCHAGTYINSFFTTFGVESFAGPLGLGTSTANSVCVNTQNGQGGDQDFTYARVDDDYLGDDYTYYDGSAYTSQGTGCSAKGDIVIDSYDGPFCHGRDYAETLDQLEEFNQKLREMDCTEIYSASNNYNNNNNDRKLQTEEQETNTDERQLEEDGIEFDYEYSNLPAVQILSFSKSCSVSQYPQDCPDPYGKKKKYAQNIQRALAFKTGRLRDLGTNIVKTLSWIFFGAALTLMALIYSTCQEEDAKAARKQAKLRRKARKNKNKKNNDDEDFTERGIEGKLSNLSKDDGSSKVGGKKMSCLGIPRIKLPKKLRMAGCPSNRGGGENDGNQTDIDDDASIDVSLSEHHEYVHHNKAIPANTTAASASKASEEAPGGYFAMDSLFTNAASFVGYSAADSSGQQDTTANQDISATTSSQEVPQMQETNAAEPTRTETPPTPQEPQTVSSFPATAAEWGMAPEDDDESTSSGHSRGKKAVKAVAKSAKQFPTKLRAILPNSPERKAKKEAKQQKKLEEEEEEELARAMASAAAVPDESPKKEDDTAQLTCLPFPMIRTSTDDALPNSFVNMSGERSPDDIEVANTSTVSSHPFLHDSYVEPPASKSNQAGGETKAVEASLEEKQVFVIGEDDDADNNDDDDGDDDRDDDLSHKSGASKHSNTSESPKTKKKEKKPFKFPRLSSTTNSSKADSAPKSPSASKKTKAIGNAPTSPRTLNFFQKNSKNTHMATAPPAPVLSLAPKEASSSSKTSKLGFLSKPFGKQKPKIQSVDPPAEESPMEDEQPSDEEDLSQAKPKSYDLMSMVEIIEPSVAPESQKDLWSASAPESHRSMGSSNS